MAPPDASLWLPALARLESLFALASLVPVVSMIRLGRAKNLATNTGQPPAQDAPVLRRGMRVRISGLTAAANLNGTWGTLESLDQDTGRWHGRLSDLQGGEAKALKPANLHPEAQKDHALPIGIVSVVLLIISELLGCYDLFKFSAKGAGRFNALVKASKKALDEVSSSTGGSSKKSAGGLGSVFLATASKVINGVMSTDEISDAVCGLVMCLGLAVILGLLCHAAFARTKRQRMVHCAACALPLLLFGRSQAELAGKFWKGFVAEKIAGALRLPLRSAALVLANPCEVAEDGTDVGGTPASFAVMQVISLVASLSGDVVSGRVGRALAQFRSNPWEPTAFFDSDGVAVVLPVLLSILWLSWVHLRNKPGSLSIAALMSTAVSPLVLAAWWPVVAKWLGQKGSPEALVSLLSLLFAGEIMALFLSGGTVCLLAGMGMLHMLSAIHGMEALGMA